MSLPSIRSKRDLFDFFQQSILGTYEQLLKDKRLVHENNLLKTYLLENDFGSEEDPISFIKNSFRLSDNSRNKPKVKLLDNELLSVCFNDATTFYIDITDRRIWNIHTLSDSKICDLIIRKASTSTNFDSIWLSHGFLKNFQNIGVSRGFGLEYDYQKFYKEDVAPALKMQISGSVNFDKIYSALDAIPDLKDQVSLSKIKIKTFDTDNASNFILQDIKYNGKITAKGSDFELHLANIQELKSRYHLQLKKIEDNYRIKWSNDNGNLKLTGSAIHLIKSGAPLDQDLLAEKIFDGSAPFKLLGLPEKNNSGYTINVIDLHIGTSFTIDLLEDKFIFYLRNNVCGNSILRFLTNLQHTYSNSFKVVNDNGENILEA